MVLGHSFENEEITRRARAVDQGGKTPVAGVSQRAPPDAGRAPHDLTFLLLNRHGICVGCAKIQHERANEPASQLPAPKFNLELGPFYLSGNGVYDASNECNWVNNGKGDWNIKFDNSGEDLKGSLANPPCPF